jgi:2,3-diketo-5-methylthio-1-phosphopentane phosphatase
LNRHLDGVEIDPAFADFVALCRAARVPLTIVSDGLDYAIHRILNRYGIVDVPVVANRLESLGANRYRLAFPHGNMTCASASGTCKCKVAETQTAGRALSLLIGDGASDICAAGSVDLVFAKDTLLTYCREKSLPFVAFRDFSEASRLLETLLDEPLRLGVATAVG